MPTAPPAAALRYQAVSAAAAQAGVRAAKVARPRGLRAMWGVIATYQTAQAQLAEQATAAMLAAQDIGTTAEALLNSSAFTTSVSTFEAMVREAEQDWEFDRLVEAMIQDAGRTAQSVSITARPHIGFVRLLNPPSCARCAVLAGRVYRYSHGFQRHPGCDCVMLPTTLANDEFVHDPADLIAAGQVTGLSKADRRALADGADLGQVVNVRLRKAGITDSGRVISRRGRPTPEAIYRTAGDDREAALELLEANGYVRKPASHRNTPGGQGGSNGPPAPPFAAAAAGGDREPDWAQRQAALEGPNFDSAGQRLDPNEVQFAERMVALGERLRWIEAGTETDEKGTLPSNDFIWLSAGGLLVEHKSLAESTTIDAVHINRQVQKALDKNRRSHTVENILVDVGDRPVADEIIAGLRSLYASPRAFKRLWLMSEGRLIEVVSE